MDSLTSSSLTTAIDSLRHPRADIPNTEVIELGAGVILRMCSYAPTGEEVKTTSDGVEKVQTREGYTDETTAEDMYEYEIEYLPIDFRIGVSPAHPEFDVSKSFSSYSDLVDLCEQLEAVFRECYQSDIEVAHKFPDNLEFEFDDDLTWVLHDKVEETVWFYGPIVNLPIE